MTIRCVATLLALTLAQSARSAQPSERIACDTIQFRFVDATASPRALRLRDRRTGATVALDDTVVLNAAGIARVDLSRHVMGRDTMWDVVATLAQSAKSRFATVTAAHVGETLAVRLGDEVVGTGVLRSSLSAKAPIIIDVSKATADSFAIRAGRAISARCLTP